MLSPFLFCENDVYALAYLRIGLRNRYTLHIDQHFQHIANVCVTNTYRNLFDPYVINWYT